MKTGRWVPTWGLVAAVGYSLVAAASAQPRPTDASLPSPGAGLDSSLEPGPDGNRRFMSGEWYPPPGAPHPVEPAGSAAKPTRYLLHLRGTGEYSRIRYRHSRSAKYEAEGIATSAPLGSVFRQGGGGRFELGVAIARDPSFAVVPRYAFSVARLEHGREEVVVTGLHQSWSSRPWWWAGTFGAELQLIRRVFCVSLELGLAGVYDPVSEPRPAKLEIDGRHAWGLSARLAAGLRVPVSAVLAVGATVSADGYAFPDYGARNSFGGFVELEYDREKAEPQ